MDDARSHISTLKMLRSFHYIDEKGKDEGINGTFCSALVMIAYGKSSSQQSKRTC